MLTALDATAAQETPPSREPLPCVAFASSPTTLTHEQTPLRTSYTFSAPQSRDIAQYDTTTQTTTVETHVVYDSFGNIIDESDGPNTLLFGYTGRPFDIYAGLQNNLNRWYDAVVGQWISKDPIGFQAGDANLLRYVGNSPLIARDPSGLEATGAYSHQDVLEKLSYVDPAIGKFWKYHGSIRVGETANATQGPPQWHRYGLVGRYPWYGRNWSKISVPSDWDSLQVTVYIVQEIAGGEFAKRFDHWLKDNRDIDETIDSIRRDRIETLKKAADRAEWYTKLGVSFMPGGSCVLAGHECSEGNYGQAAIEAGGAVAGTALVWDILGSGTRLFVKAGDELLHVPASFVNRIRKLRPHQQDEAFRILAEATSQADLEKALAKYFDDLASPTAGRNLLDETQDAMKAFRNDKQFRRWWHRNYKGGQKMSGGGRHNPDLPQEDILDGYLEWLELGKPKG